nr:uncharacterized protein LOC128687150 [Cherax quadricarinatus]
MNRGTSLTSPTGSQLHRTASVAVFSGVTPTVQHHRSETQLVIRLPITVLLPTLAYRSRYPGGGKTKEPASYFYGRIHSRPRDMETNNLFDIRGPEDRFLTSQEKPYDPSSPEYQEDREFGPLLSRLDAYFHLLGLQDDHCRMRAICQLAEDPTTFAPLSHLVLSALKKSESFSRQSLYSPAVFRFFRYYWSAEMGAARGDCAHAYPQCPADLEDIINMSVLNFWQSLASYISIKLSDE